jgi:proteasome lid subunit RPN8/RPN11
MLEMTEEVRAAIVDHAIRCAPEEACGLLAGPSGGDLVDRYFAMTNLAASATRFVLDGREMLDVEDEVERLGLEIRAVLHSHPTTAARPSDTDVADWARFDPLGVWRSVIVSLDGDEPMVGCHRIHDGRVELEEMTIS